MSDHFKRQQERLTFFESQEYRDAEKARIENSKPQEHALIGGGWVYCPIKDRKLPEWMDVKDCGDDHYDVMEPADVEN